MLNKNSDIIYNKKYVVIIPTMSIKYKQALEYSFGNTIIFDNTKDLDSTIKFLNNNNFKQIILVDYQLEYNDILNSLNKEHEIKIIYTGAMGAFSNEFTYLIFKNILDLYNKYNVSKIGFLDVNLYNTFKNKEINCYHLILDIECKESSKEYNSKNIGILNDEENPKHSYYNSLSALKFNDYTAILSNIGRVTKKFLKLFNINYKIQKNKDFYKNNLANLYINFTDNNNNMIFIESMDLNVPCILGNNEILKKDKYLSSMLVVESDDSIDEISAKIELVKKNRDKILKEYKNFRKNYSKDSLKSVKIFLECEKEKNINKTNDLLLSIVVPVYNTEKYLNSCLKSIIKSIPKKIVNNTEILIINDGSKDNSEDIILKFENKYPKLIRYINQQNHGLGNVRNVGLKEARGKYIASIDSDDTINSNFFKEALDGMENNIDIIMCDWLSVTNDSKFETCAIEWIFKDINKYEGLLYTTIMPSTCNKIVKKSLYDKLNIKFIEDKYEDLSTNPFIMLSANSIKHINKPYYEYYIRSNSIMRSSAGYSMIDVLKKFDERLKKYKDYINVDEEKFKFYTYSWRIEEFILNQLYDIEEDKIEDFIEYIYSNLYDIICEIINNKYYLLMLNNIKNKDKKYIEERNNAFMKKEFKKFILNSRKKGKYFKLNAPLIYFGDNN